MRTVLVEAVRAGRLTLDEAESHHLLRVIRVARGGRVRVVDGAGLEAEATLVDVAGATATLDVEAPRAAPPPAPVTVLLGAPKPALVEEAVTLATELGATELWLVRAERSPPGELRLDRLDRVVDAALKQCRRADRPVLRPFPSLAAALATLPPGPRFVGAPGGSPPHEAWAATAPGGVTGGGARCPITLAIGPEGGFSPAEAEALGGAGFVAVHLGRAILRAPTAVAAGLAALGATSR